MFMAAVIIMDTMILFQQQKQERKPYMFMQSMLVEEITN